MATHEISMLGGNTMPDTSGDVFQQPYSLDDTATVLDPLVWVFNVTATKIGLRGVFQVPQNFVGSVQVNAYWNSAATSGANNVWDLSYLTRSEGEDMGAAATDTTDTVTDADDVTAYDLVKSQMTGITSADFAAGDIVTFEFFRDGVNDALASDVNLFDLTFQYDDA